MPVFDSLDEAERQGFEVVADYDDCLLMVRIQTQRGYAMALCRRSK